MKIVYVATGATYYREAIRSARSALLHNTNADIYVISDLMHDDVTFVRFISLPNPTFSYLDKIEAVKQIQFDRYILLDSDTYVVGSLEPMLAVLNLFDFAAAINEVRTTPPHCIGGYTFPYFGIPIAFPEYNSGVMALRNSPSLSAFADSWLHFYHEENHLPIPSWPDQPSLRRALYHSGLRICALPSEFNLRMPYCGYFEGQVKILHGRRTEAAFNAFASKINRDLGPRVYFPRLFIMRQHSRAILLALSIRSFLTNVFRKAVVQPTFLIFTNVGRDHSKVVSPDDSK